MIRLCVGISSLSPAWKSLFDQLGINVEKIDFSTPITNRYSCLIINSTINQEYKNQIYSFLYSEMGGVLFCKNVQSIFCQERISANLQRNFPYDYSNAIKQYYLGKGLIFCLNFDPDLEFSRTDYKRKRFPFKKGYHPDEMVSSVNHENLRYTIEILIKELHYHRNLPLVSKWHSPSVRPFFAFRIDTDFGTQESIDELYKLSDYYQIPMTWFLHVQAHEEWLDCFRSMKNQEIALHGYEHGTSSSYEQIMNNIQRGRQLMIDEGLTPKGFSIPYSIWNDTLGDVLNQFDFKYSSEFTLGYDTDPFYPIHKNRQHSTLQIPIHPICTGNMNRLNSSEIEMEQYFKLILDQKIEYLQNVIFYHHPMQVGLNIWKKIFEEVNRLGLPKLTFSEIADFWIHRKKYNVNTYFDKRTSFLTCKYSNYNYLLSVSINFDDFFLLRATEMNKPLASFNSIPNPKQHYLSKESIEELNGNRIKLLKTSIFDWKNRIKL